MTIAGDAVVIVVVDVVAQYEEGRRQARGGRDLLKSRGKQGGASRRM